MFAAAHGVCTHVMGMYGCGHACFHVPMPVAMCAYMCGHAWVHTRL